MLKISAKAVTCVAASLATWLVTSSILARQQAKPSPSVITSTPASHQAKASGGPLLDDGKKKVTSQIIETPRDQRAAGKMASNVDGIASMQLGDHRITIVDGVATVKAHVSIADKRPGQLYIWRLRVVSHDGQPLAGMVYDKQMFSVEEGGKKEVDFADTVQVPEGAKRVELVLYEKSPNEDLSFLDDHDAANAHRLIRVVERVKN